MATSGRRTTTALDGDEKKPLADAQLAASTDAARKAAKPAKPEEPQFRTVEKRLYDEAFVFEFFQAVRLLERRGDVQAVGRDGPIQDEAVRFKAHLSFNFPPSSLVEIKPSENKKSPPEMTVSFFGLTGPSGVLPRFYSEQMFRLERDTKHPEKHALRAWFDLFNHRLISLFYRAWEKYRFYIPYERGEYAEKEPDPFTQALLSFIGIGLPTLRNRLSVSHVAPADEDRKRRTLAAVEDLALIHYSGLLAQRPRTAIGLEQLLADYFGVPLNVRQFQGSWLKLEPSDQTQLGFELGNCLLGVNTVVGERVWDVEDKFRICIGPLDYSQFTDMLPDQTPVSERKAIFILAHLVRMYVGPTLAFDVQLILKPREVPQCQLSSSSTPGPRLGWNTWLTSQPFKQPAADAVFATDEVFWLNA